LTSHEVQITLPRRLAALTETTIEKLRATIREDTFAHRYELLHESGAGGMGRVFAAIERASERRLAIKVLTGRSPEDLARFEAEAAILERLDHPTIVRYIGHGVTSDGDPYLAMAWLDGETLDARLAREKLSLADAVLAATRIADALVHAHDAGIIHRDVKPSNVLLVDGDPARATLIDFGIAKVAAAPRDITHTGQLVGTPGYMAPEQALGRHVLDARVDLFALGCLLYEAVSGTAPFGGVAAMEVLARVLLEQPAPLAGAPPRLAVLVQTLLAKDPSQRQGDARVVVAELTAIHTAIVNYDRTALETSPLGPTPRAARPRSYRNLAIVGTLALAGGIAIGALALRGDSPEPPAVAESPPVTEPAVVKPVDSPGGLDGKYVGYQDLRKQTLLPERGGPQPKRTNGSVTIREEPPGTLLIKSGTRCSVIARREGLRGIVTGEQCTSSTAPFKLDSITGEVELVAGADGKLSLLTNITHRMSAELGPDDRRVHTEVEVITKFVGDRAP
jgi:serine/threonine protein kinase